MQKATIKGYFNPREQGDTFKGLGIHMGMDGTVGSHVEQNLPKFLKDAGRDYYVTKVPAMVFDKMAGIDANGQPYGEAVEVPGKFFLARSNDGRVISPKTVSSNYGVLSLMDIADELQPFCDQGWATPDGVYAGQDESLEVVTLRLDAGGNLPDGEKFQHYIMVQNPHGLGKAKGKIISFRIVCANTFAMAVSSESDFCISHRVAREADQAEIMKGRAAFAIQQWENVQTHISKLAERIQTFSSINLTEADALSLTDKLIGVNGKTLEQMSGQAKTRRDLIMRGFNMPEMGTNGSNAYDWLNAVTWAQSSPVATAKSKVSAEARMIRNVSSDGTGARMELAARKLAESLV